MILSSFNRFTKRAGKRRRGAVLVEAAIVVPVFLVFFIGILEYCRYIMMLQVVTNAAREGARYALTHTLPATVGGVTAGNATSDVTTVVSKAMAGKTLTGQTVQVFQSDSLGNNIGAWTDTQADGYICVRITGTFPFIANRIFYAPTSFSVTSQAVVRCEAN